MWSQAANLTAPEAKPYLACYPIPALADASDGIFIMSTTHKESAVEIWVCFDRLPVFTGYDMWHQHQVCAGPNSPLSSVNASIQSYIDIDMYLALGARPEKLIMGLPFYGYEYRCNDSFASPSTFAPYVTSACVVGDVKHYSTEHYGVGARNAQRFQRNASTGCKKG